LLLALAVGATAATERRLQSELRGRLLNPRRTA
jgi:hypothetical protein